MENALPDLLEAGFPGGQRVTAYTFTNYVYMTHPPSAPAKINQAQRSADFSFFFPLLFFFFFLLPAALKESTQTLEAVPLEAALVVFGWWWWWDYLMDITG